jgi:serine O-acetyltransferase
MKATLAAVTSIEPANHWGVERVVAELRDARNEWRTARQRRQEFGNREFPSPAALREIAAGLCGALFPMRLGPTDLRRESEDFYVGHTLVAALNGLYQQITLELRGRSVDNLHLAVQAEAADIVQAFAEELPSLRVRLDQDVEAAYLGDPAAHSADEVLLCYPGVLAVIHHRLAHAIYRRGAPVVARMLAEIAHSRTGIDIHPGARIGTGFFIDHGTGIVIGETAVIGENVRLYQAVTLGARRFTVGASGALEKGEPRHPILEDDVVVYAGATILGRITVGQGSSIGGNVWLTHSVPPHSIVTQAGVQYAAVTGVGDGI